MPHILVVGIASVDWHDAHHSFFVSTNGLTIGKTYSGMTVLLTFMPTGPAPKSGPACERTNQSAQTEEITKPGSLSVCRVFYSTNFAWAVPPPDRNSCASGGHPVLSAPNCWIRQCST